MNLERPVRPAAQNCVDVNRDTAVAGGNERGCVVELDAARRVASGNLVHLSCGCLKHHQLADRPLKADHPDSRARRRARHNECENEDDRGE